MAGQIENATDIGLFLRRHAEPFAKDFEFFLRDDAVSACHLASQCDHRDGECHTWIAFPVQKKMAGQCSHQRAHGSGDKKTGRGATDFAPD